jgi:hypothetical protein
MTATTPAIKLAPVIILDRSKKFSTIHGERSPDDPHYQVHFWQDDLPFDSNGELVADDGKTAVWDTVDPDDSKKTIRHHPLYSEKRRARLKAKQDRAAKAQVDHEPVVDEDSAEEEQAAASSDVNLVAWLEGKARYKPYQLYAAAKVRYAKHYTRLRDLVEDLVYEEKLVPEDRVSPDLLALVNASKAA